MRDFEIRQILVPTDLSAASHPALKYARLFAERFAADMTLLYVDPILYTADSIAPLPETDQNLPHEVRTYADELLRGKQYEVVVVRGDAMAMILREAQQRAADLMVMATHGLRGWRRTILGSVTEGVLHGADCPVLSVSRADGPPASPSAGVTKILCPVNFSEVARHALRCASELAQAFACELVFVHVIEAEAGRDEADEQRIRSWIAPEIQDRCQYREIVLRGGAAERVLDCAEDSGADLIVVGAQHKLFRDATVIGTTTERLVRFARCPVLTVTRRPAVAEKVA